MSSVYPPLTSLLLFVNTRLVFFLPTLYATENSVDIYALTTITQQEQQNTSSPKTPALKRWSWLMYESLLKRLMHEQGWAELQLFGTKQH